MSLFSPVSPLQPGKERPGLARPLEGEPRDPNAKMLEATKEEGMKMAGTAMEWLSARLPFSASKPKDVADMGNMLVNMVDSSQPAVQATAAIRAGARSQRGGAGQNLRDLNKEKEISQKILDQIKKHGKQLQAIANGNEPVGWPQGQNKPHVTDPNGGGLSEEALQFANKTGDAVKVLMETLKFWYRTAGDSSMAIARNI